MTGVTDDGGKNILLIRLNVAKAKIYSKGVLHNFLFAASYGYLRGQDVAARLIGHTLELWRLSCHSGAFTRTCLGSSLTKTCFVCVVVPLFNGTRVVRGG